VPAESCAAGVIVDAAPAATIAAVGVGVGVGVGMGGGARALAEMREVCGVRARAWRIRRIEEMARILLGCGLATGLGIRGVVT
jgi:hypothetical protein